jgi:hypothetical protein
LGGQRERFMLEETISKLAGIVILVLLVVGVVKIISKVSKKKK